MDYFKEVFQLEFSNQKLITGAQMCDIDVRDFTELSLFLMEYNEVEYGRVSVFRGNLSVFRDNLFEIRFRGMPYPKSSVISETTIMPFTYDFVMDPSISIYNGLGFDQTIWLGQGHNNIQHFVIPVGDFNQTTTTSTTTTTTTQYTDEICSLIQGLQGYKKGSISKENPIVYSLHIEKNTENYFFVELDRINQYHYDHRYFICDQIDGLIEFIDDVFKKTQVRELIEENRVLDNIINE